jgi:hypothetical protein
MGKRKFGSGAIRIVGRHTSTGTSGRNFYGLVSDVNPSNLLQYSFNITSSTVHVFCHLESGKVHDQRSSSFVTRRTLTSALTRSTFHLTIYSCSF